MEELIFGDITKTAIEKDRFSNVLSEDKWHAVKYETGYVSGVMVYAKSNMKPQPLTLDFCVAGKWHVYLGCMNMGGDTTATFSFTGKDGFFPVRTFGWMAYLPTEWIEENYFGVVDFTDNKLVLSARTDLGRNASLCYIRLVKCGGKSKEKKKNIIYHYDCDYYREENHKTLSEKVKRIEMLADGSAEILVHETNCFGNAEIGKNIYPFIDKDEMKKELSIQSDRPETDKEVIKLSHTLGIKAYAGLRLQMGNFCFPSSSGTFWFNEFENHNRKYSVKTRLGKGCGMLSYAYEEVRKYVIDLIVKEVASGWDGVSLFFHRGTFIGFETPVADKVKELYGVDANTLPRRDERLKSVLCSFLTEFMVELDSALKKKFDRKIEVNVITLYGAEESKRFGFDVKTWAEKGLIDSVSQGLMAFTENLGDSVGQDGIIDLEKYEKYLAEWFTVWRDIPFNEERLLSGAKEYLQALCGTNVRFCATLGWERDEPERVMNVVDELRRMGITHFNSWNTNHKAKHLHVLNFEKYYAGGSLEEYEDKKVKYKRVLSLDGMDISENTPNWRG